MNFSATAALGVLLVVVVEVTALAAPDRRIVPVAAGIAVAVVLWALRTGMTRAGDRTPVTGSDDVAKSLQGWRSRTQTLIDRADMSRQDWDRHLRPMLARQFELATGQSKRKDRQAFQATGEALLGAQLWAWVDPDGVNPAAGGQPGPGREALAEILRRIERV